MCGIAGTYRWHGGSRLVEQMCDATAHRGPDGQHLWSATLPDGAEVHLGQVRLAIIDPTAASDQPFVKDGLSLIYNGELYNFRELRRELEGRGVRFRSAGDTEVILEAWRAWGTGALHRLRGMFAFAIFDHRSGELTLARDHLGIKPLLYTVDGAGAVAFCSELKGLTVAMDRIELDPSAMVASLMYYWIPEDHCAVRDVVKLPPGALAVFRPDGTWTTERYWQVQRDAVGGPEMSVEELREVLVDSVTRHLISDVGVSTFLSGGLDSSLVAVLAKERHHDLDAYTIGFRAEDRKLEAMPDDLKYARIIAQRHGITLHEIEIAPDVVSMLPEIVHTLDEPIGDAASINTVLICRAARERGVKVLLSGMGADELFGGYRKHYACLLAAKYQRLPQFLRHQVISRTIGALPVAVGSKGLKAVRWAKRFDAFASLDEEAAFRRSYTHYGRDEFGQLLDPALMVHVDQLIDEHAAIYHDQSLGDPVNRMCMADTRMFLPGLNLTYTDRSSMAASCEVRTPFVDVEVAKAAFSIPGHRKIEGRERKAVLKKAAEAWLPDEIIYRPKGLFSAPLRAWIRRDLSEMVDDVVVNGRLVAEGFLNGAEVRRMVEADRAGREDRSKEIWQFLTLELWQAQMREKFDPAKQVTR